MFLRPLTTHHSLSEREPLADDDLQLLEVLGFVAFALADDLSGLVQQHEGRESTGAELSLYGAFFAVAALQEPIVDVITLPDAIDLLHAVERRAVFVGDTDDFQPKRPVTLV